MKGGEGLLKVIAIPDLQCPNHDEIAVSTAIEIVRGEHPDYLIHVGDVVDFKSISKYLDSSWTEAQTTADFEIDSANKVLDRFDAVMPKHGKTVYLEGNHDRRLELFFIQHAAKLGSAFKGISIQDQMGIERRGYKYISTKFQPYRIDEHHKLSFLHGWYTNKYHAAKTVINAGQSVMYGHAHDFQVYTCIHLDKEAPRIGMSIGCLCQFRQSYLNGMPMNWAHGVGLVYIDKKTGRFWPYFCPIIAGECVINGVVYRGK